MKTATIIVVTLMSALGMSAIALALPGPVIGGAIAEYDFSTGQIVVSYDGVNNWSIESASSSLSGNEPAGLPLLGVVTNTDSTIGDAGFSRGTATDLNLGNVAEPGLPLGDLTISWSWVADPHGTAPVTYINVPEPTSIALALTVVIFYIGRRRAY